MSGKTPQNKKPTNPSSPQSLPTPTITGAKREPIEIVSQGATINHRQQPTNTTPPPAEPNHKLQVSQPKRDPVSLQISPETQQQLLLRKQEHTYTIEQLKAKRHTRELTAPSVFQFYAELQLFRRFITQNHINRGVKQSDMPVLQHRINQILSSFNVDTFQNVFNLIMALGTDSEVFVLSYVNVVFKQAVLNPNIALLFSMLSVNISYVMKHTNYAKRMRELFLERCKESFYIPKEETDKGTMVLLQGIVTFAGNLLRDGMLPHQLLYEWTKNLMKSGTKNSLMMLINLLNEAGTGIMNLCPDILEELKEKMKSATDKELLDCYARLNDTIQSAIPPAEQIDRELHNPEMKHSPSMDHTLDGKYTTLFKRSSSIPLELDALADEENDENEIASVVTNYLYNSNLSEAVDKLGQLGYNKNELRTAVDLLRAVVEQPANRLLVISELVVDLLYQDFYSVELLKQAFQDVAKEHPDDVECGKKLVLIFAQLLSKEVVTFDDFEPLFENMKGIWTSIIPSFFQETDKLLGVFAIDEMKENDFWRQAKFIESNDIAEILTKMHEMDILDFYPQYKVAYNFREQVLAKNDEKASNAVLSSAHIDEHPSEDKKELVALLFEVLLSFNDQTMEYWAGKLKKPYFEPMKPLLEELSTKFGERGHKLLSLF